LSIILSGSFSTKSNNNKEKDKDKEPDAIPKKKYPLTNIRPRVQELYTRLSCFKDSLAL
jgi:hypothetical protein